MTPDWLLVERRDAPLIVSIPHAGTELAEYEPRFVSPWFARRDADWHIPELYDFAAALGATIVRTEISRSVVDVNRNPDGLSLYPGQATTELCPTTTFDGEPIYREGETPGAAEVAERRARYYAPYHEALRNEIDRLRRTHARVALYDAHSIRSVIPRLFDGELPVFNLGTNSGESCSPALRDRLAATLCGERPRASSSTAASRAAGSPATSAAPRRASRPCSSSSPAAPTWSSPAQPWPDNWPGPIDEACARRPARRCARCWPSCSSGRERARLKACASNPHPPPSAASLSRRERAAPFPLGGRCRPKATDEGQHALHPTRKPPMTLHSRLDNMRVVRAPRGPERTAKSWLTEAPLRMLMNNLDPDVAERPGELVVYGGIGRAARDWNAFDTIVETLRRLEADETLLVQSGKPVGVFRTHADAPRVLIANSNLVPRWATWDHFHELDRKGLMMYGQMTAGSWIYIGSQGIVQGTYETFVEMGRRHYGGSLKGRWILTAGLGGMGGAQPLSATFAGASMLAVECRPSSIDFRLRTGYLDVAAQDARRGARNRRPLGEGRQARLGRAPRQRRRSSAGARAARRQARHRHRPDVGARSGQRLPAEGLDACSSGRSAAPPIPRASSGRRARRWPTTCAPCSASSTPASRPSTTATTSVRWRSRRASATRSTFRASCPPTSGPLFCRGVGPFRWAALSGDPEDIYRTDARVKELIPDDPHLHNWLDMARDRIKFQGLPARICWVGLGDRDRLGLAFNEMVAKGELKAPIVIGRDHLDSGSVASPNRETEAMQDGSDAVSDWPLLNALLNCASRRDLGVAAPRRRRRHGLLAARRHGGRVRRHARSRAAHRPRPVERPGHRRHAPRRRRLRGGDRVRESEGAGPAESLKPVGRKKRVSSRRRRDDWPTEPPERRLPPNRSQNRSPERRTSIA